MGKRDDSSWVSLGIVLVAMYWGCYFAIRLVQWLGGDGLFVFAMTCVVVGFVYRGALRWSDKRIGLLFSDDFSDKSKNNQDVPLPFFVKGQVRRRKLDLTRSSNFIRDNVQTKRKRQVGGLFRLKRKRRS